MVKRRGTMFVDEVAFPIVDIRLREGLVVFIAERSEPCPALDAPFFTVFGEDGKLVVRGNVQIHIPAIREGLSLRFEQPMLAGDNREGDAI